jgi:hypothetical protein
MPPVPLWIGRSAFVVATGHGLARIEGAKEQIHRYPRGTLKRDEDPPEIELFAPLDADATRALVRRRREPCMLWSADGLHEIDGPELVDAVSLGEGKLLVVAHEDDELVLRRATVEEDVVTLGDRIALPAPVRAGGVASVWKEARWPENDPEPDEDAPFDPRALSRGGRGRVRLHGNRCGITVTSTYNGAVALLDPQSLEPRFSVRIPSHEDQFDIFALAVPKGGTLVTVVENYRQTVFVLLGDDGAVVQHRDTIGKEAAWGSSSPGVLWSDDRVLVNQCIAGGAVYTLSLPKLDPKKFGAKGDDAEAFFIDSGSDPTGKRHLLAFTDVGHARPQSWRLVRYDVKKTKADSAELPMPEFKPPPPPPAPLGLKRAEGPPTLGLVAEGATPWRTAPGKVTTVALKVVNKGGPLRGVYVEIGGNAISDQILTGTDAAVDGSGTGEFTKRGSVLRAELPEVQLEAGLADKKGAPPDAEPTLQLIVGIRGERAGSSLMTIRVGPLGATGSSGSALQGRSFVVESA